MEDIFEMTLLIVTLNHQSQIDICGSCEDIQNILCAFGATCQGDSGQIATYQKCSQEIKDNLKKLIPLDKNNHVFGKLYNIFKNMDCEDLFAVLPQKLTDDEIKIVRDEILRRTLGDQYENYVDYYNNCWKDIDDNYEMIFFDNRNNTMRSIGEKERSKRICRFCGLKIPNTSFDSKSHSISEALGNKIIVTNDECDDCNANFGEHIERDLINYLDFFRVYFGIQRKGGQAQLVSSDFKISKDDNQDVISGRKYQIEQR